MDKAFGLAIGLRSIGLGADVLETEALAGFAEGDGFVARTVVGHDPLDLDAQACVVGDRGLEEAHGAALSFVLHDLAEGDPGSIVDTDVDVFPAGSFAASPQVALPGSIAGDAMAYTVELAELFDVDVDQLAGVFALIAPHRLGRFQVAPSIQAEPPQDTADGRWRDTDLGCDLLAGVALPAQRLDFGTCGDRGLAWR